MAELDFSPIGDLFNTYKKSRQQADSEAALANYAQNGGQFDPATRQLIASNPALGMSLAQLSLANKRDERDFGFRQQEAQRAQGNTDNSHRLAQAQFRAGIEGSKVPPGFRPKPGGGLEPIPNGPADPEYIRSTNEAKEKPRQMSAGDITKLSEEGGKFSSVNGFIDSFKDEFAGQVAGGDIRNMAGRNLPTWATTPEAQNSSIWWQGYDKYKNVVRNDLFGSALTPSEQEAFMRADISPNMNPKAVKENLKIQQTILQGAMKKKAGALLSEGFRPETVSRGFGIKLEDLGVEPPKKGKSGGEQPPVPGARQGKKPDGSMGWFVQNNGKTYLVE